MKDNERIADVPMPEVALIEGEKNLKEVQDIVNKARSKSAPGPNGIPYKEYKLCPKLLRRLWKLLKVVWRKGMFLRSGNALNASSFQKKKTPRILDSFVPYPC